MLQDIGKPAVDFVGVVLWATPSCSNNSVLPVAPSPDKSEGRRRGKRSRTPHSRGGTPSLTRHVDVSMKGSGSRTGDGGAAFGSNSGAPRHSFSNCSLLLPASR